MGQRSQIYIRYNGDIKVANYYQWNYGERMISRARAIIEKLKNEYLHYHTLWNNEWDINKLKRYCDVNFDMRDIVQSCDIMQELKEFKTDDNTYNDIMFNQDNNDGQLFIDIVGDKIKYCFVEFYTSDKILDAEHYLRWNINYSRKIRKWENHIVSLCNKEVREETIKYTKDNIQYINNNAELMTFEELQDFVNTEYDENGKQIKPF